MVIEVTQEDINQGVRLVPGACAVALACRRAGLAGAFTDGYSVQWEYGRCALPGLASNFVADFDMSLDVSPFTFKLEISDYASQP